MIRTPKIMLASRSPRRAALLAQLGLEFDLIDAEVDERPRPGETADTLALRLARAKAEAGVRGSPGAIPVLGADTVVSLDGRLYGKPCSGREAASMLGALSGRSHEVFTAVCLATSDGVRTEVSRSVVTFRNLSKREIDLYCASGEPEGKAGAYAIQGLAAIFVEHLQGSYSGIMGLPLFETARLLNEAGIEVLNICMNADLAERTKNELAINEARRRTAES